MRNETVARYTGKFPTTVGEAVTPSDHVRATADSFYRAVCSGGFSWMGLLKIQDRLGRQRLVIYLAEPPQLPESSAFSSRVNLGTAFTELSLALHPTILDIYYIESEGDGASNLAIQDAKYRHPARRKPQFLWEVDLREH